jgi:hypothetical protein
MVISIKASHPGPEAVKHPQTITLPPPCLTFGMRFLLWNAVFVFYPVKMGRMSSKKLNQVFERAHGSTWLIITFLDNMGPGLNVNNPTGTQ